MAKKTEADAGEKLGGHDISMDVDAPLRIIIGGPPHSGKSTLMHLLEDKFNQYGVDVELIDMDLSAPTDLRGPEGFSRSRAKRDWTDEMAREARRMFEEASGTEVVLGDSVGLISSITEILAQPADVAILIVMGNHGDYNVPYKGVVRKWKNFYAEVRKPLLVVVRSSLNPDEESIFDAQDNYGVMVGLDRFAYEHGVINSEDACIEGIVFEIAQAFDLIVSSRPTKEHMDVIEAKWPSVKDIESWTPESAPNLSPQKRIELADIEENYFREKGRSDFQLMDDYRLSAEYMGGGYKDEYPASVSCAWCNREFNPNRDKHFEYDGEFMHDECGFACIYDFMSGGQYRGKWKAESFEASVIEAKGRLARRQGSYYNRVSADVVRRRLKQDPEFWAAQKYLFGGMSIFALGWYFIYTNTRGK